MIPKEIEAITKGDLDALAEDKVLEGPTLEYKREFPRKESLLKALCALANTGNGDLLVGVEQADDGPYPKGFPGIPADFLETARGKIERWARSGLEPAFVNFRIQPVEVTSGLVLVIRVWRSWAPRTESRKAPGFMAEPLTGAMT